MAHETAVVTVLFCDVVRSTELLSTLGDDANDVVRRLVLAALEKEVHAHRGSFVKSMGDGAMAAFRSSAADAVSCAADMQRAISRLEIEGRPLGLRLRVGIGSGEASHEGGDWFGSPVVEAARLEQAARPGQILVSEVVRSLVGTRGGAQFRGAGRRDLKGFQRPVAVAEVLWQDTATPRVKVGRRSRFRIADHRRLLLVLGVAAASLVAVPVIILLARDGEGDSNAARRLELSSPGYTPTLEQRECPPELASANARLLCRDLVVPETRAAPAGRTIRLLVTIAPGLSGSGGTPTLSLGDYWFGPHALSEDGDGVTMGLRGQRYSEPLLTCPEMTEAWRRSLALPANGAEANLLVLDAADQCGARLERTGVDLDRYGYDDVMDDVRDLAIAMNWSSINLQAALDSTPAAIFFNARYPGLVRSMVLVEPFPPSWGRYDDRIENFDLALDAYFGECAADDACSRALPDLRQVLQRTFDELEQAPRRVSVRDPYSELQLEVLIDGDRLVTALLRGVGEHDALPFLAFALVSQDERTFITTAEFIVETSGLAPDVPWGAGISQFCEDVDSHISRSGVSVREAAHPLLRVFAHDPILEVCVRWPTRPAEDFVVPPPSDVPALIVTGSLNPYAPPAYADETSRSFRNPRVGVLPRTTQAMMWNGPPCLDRIRREFLRDPLLEIDIAGCIEETPAIEFAGT